MKSIENCLLVAGELRERAKSHGPLSRRARMLILAERLETVAGAPQRSADSTDPVHLALDAYAKLRAQTAIGSSKNCLHHPS